MLRTHKIAELNEHLVGHKVTLCGWIDVAREHGKVIFIDLRDKSGKVQCVIIQKNKDFETVKRLSKESCIKIQGIVNLRPKGSENIELATGKVEVFIDGVEIFNACPDLPYQINEEGINEDVRLKYRFLDLRSSKMQGHLIARAKLFKAVRSYLDSKEFNEIETPMLVKYTPGGARNYLVPSRFEAGKFWALPESPQLFKQLLMVAGMEKYYQIAKCLRDEDLRKDRQPEFTQIDMEMSFLTQEDILELTEGLLKKIWKEVLNVDISTPFPRMTYKEAMKKYNSDKPDIRKNKNNPKEFAFLWVVDFPLFQKAEGKYVANHHPFTSPNMEDFKKDPYTAKSWAYDIVLNGVEIGGGSLRIHNQEVQQKVFEILDVKKEEQEKRFKFLLDALKYGAPPHGGIALGVDRLMQLLLNTESIREVIAFPKNSDGKDVMLQAPCEVSEQQLKDLHIKVIKEKPKEGKKEVKAKKK
ncbi:MAG: aspartate--tRNA ligase [Nanoarchaeota archaeon]